MAKQTEITEEQLKIQHMKQLSVDELKMLLEINEEILSSENEDENAKTKAKIEIHDLKQELNSREFLEDLKETFAWASANEKVISGSIGTQAIEAKIKYLQLSNQL
nr:uncharacterized protein LOC111508391 [Leptinotarsa decemlineata]